LSTEPWPTTTCTLQTTHHQQQQDKQTMDKLCRSKMISLQVFLQIGVVRMRVEMGKSATVGAHFISQSVSSSLHSRCKQGTEKEARTQEKKWGVWGLGTRQRLLQRPPFFNFCGRWLVNFMGIDVI